MRYFTSLNCTRRKSSRFKVSWKYTQRRLRVARPVWLHRVKGAIKGCYRVQLLFSTTNTLHVLYALKAPRKLLGREFGGNCLRSGHGADSTDHSSERKPSRKCTTKPGVCRTSARRHRARHQVLRTWEICLRNEGICFMSWAKPPIEIWNWEQKHTKIWNGNRSRKNLNLKEILNENKYAPSHQTASC